MRAFPAALERLTEQFARLPGIGMKSAQRLAFYVQMRYLCFRHRQLRVHSLHVGYLQNRLPRQHVHAHVGLLRGYHPVEGRPDAGVRELLASYGFGKWQT